MKKGLSLFLSLIMVLGILTSMPLTVNAVDYDGDLFEDDEIYDKSTGLFFTFFAKTESYSVFDCNEEMSGEIVIPSTFNDLPVTRIDDYAFDSCSYLTSIVIPDSVTHIGEEAFEDCSSLKSIIIPDSVISIGDNAFEYCDSLISVNLGNNVASIGNYAFEYCRSLETITIPDSVTSIGNYAFYECSQITSITIPDSVMSIGDHAFDNCSSLTSIIIPNSVTSIGNYLFGYCRSLSSVTIPDSVITIGENAFYSCKSLTSITIPESVVNIGESAFGYSGLSDVYFSGTLTEWTKIKIEDYGNSLLTGARIHYSIVDSSTHWSKDDYESSCTGNMKYSCSCGYEYTEKVSDGKGHIFINGICSVCKFNVLAYELNEDGKSYSVTDCDKSASGEIIIPATYNGLPVTNVGKETFKGCNTLIALTIPDCVTEISANNFIGCYSLKEINISDETLIGNGRVYGAREKILDDTQYFNNTDNWDNGVLYLGSNLIAAKTDIKGSYQIKPGTKTIADNAFALCRLLETVIIPEGVVSIGRRAFCDCDSIKEIIIPESVTEIEKNAIGFNSGGLNPDTAYDGKVDIAYKVEDFKILGDKNSVAETYANENGFEFVDINHTHTPSSWITDTKATVYKAGSKHKECTECGEILETAKIAQLKCSKPKLSKIENTADGVKITWSKVSGADKYDVYRKTGSKGKYSKIGSTTKTYYTDKKASSGKKYYYYVKAINEAGSSSASSSKSIYHLADTILSTPKSTKSGITLKWKKVTGADGYMVYRKTGSGSYSKIVTVKGNTKVTYTDKSAKKGKKYTYKIKAYKSKTYSAYSNTKTIKDKY